MRPLVKTIVLFMLACASCNKYVEVQLPPHKPKLVLHGYVATGDFFEVAINKSAAANTIINGDETYVNEAWVLLYENDVFRDSLRWNAQEKRYASTTVVATPGRTYRITAGANGFETVEAIALAPSPVNTVAVTHERQTRTTPYGQLLDDVRFSFHDPGAQQNFYLMAIYPSYWHRVGLACVYSNDPAIERIQGDALPFSEGDCLQADEIFFSDKSFDGTIKELTLSAWTRGLDTEVDTSGNLHRPYLKRYSISEDYYRYLKTTLSMYAGGEIPSLSEPVSIKGNVKNGYGLFAVFSVTTDTIR